MNIYNYGFIHNNISINHNKFIKQSKNEIAKIKINNEIQFYLFILNNHIQFPLPKLYEYTDGKYVIEYILNSTTLTKIINKNNVFYYYNIVKNYLKNLHKNIIPISKNILYTDLQIELYDKIINRYNEFDWNNNPYFNRIKSVNNVPIKNIHTYCNIIYNKCIQYLNINQRNYYNCIHGDTHLGNILITYYKNYEQLYFIDPRGVFGSTKYYGLYEYDYAKFLFGLSGYSIFDESNIDKLDIDFENNNINIDFIKKYEYIFDTNYFNELEIYLCCSIWLGNNSCFVDINKKIMSLMIAFYYCEKNLFK